MNTLITKKNTKKKEKELNKIMKIDKILETIVKVANGALIVNNINLYWYAQILWIMVSWKKEYFKPIISESVMDKINIQLFYADQFRKLIISSVTSYYSDVVREDEINDKNEEKEEEIIKSNYSQDIYSYSDEEEEEEENEEEDKKENDSESESESESEYISEFKTETIPETTKNTSVAYTKSELNLETRRETNESNHDTSNSNSLPHYSTVHFISDSTRQFITLSLFTWLMVQKKKYAIAKRSIDKAYQILEKITNVSIYGDELSFTSLFEEENDYYPHIVLKFERIVIILAGTWLVEAEKIIINETELNKEQKPSLPVKPMNKTLQDEELENQKSLVRSVSRTVDQKKEEEEQYC